MGEMLGLRWDFAFYQMIVETGALSYWRGNRAGDVKPAQNNFAGLGATGKGERGESFARRRDGRAGPPGAPDAVRRPAGRQSGRGTHAQCKAVGRADALAADLHAADHLCRHGSQVGAWNQDLRRHAETVADRFHAEVCNGPDPRPGLVQEAGAPQPRNPSAATTADNEPAAARPSGAELVQRAIEQAKAEGNDRRSALGAQACPGAVRQPPRRSRF